MSRHNLVLIIADQLRRSALGCNGDPNVATPAIDSLAASGVRFRNVSSTYPVCVPFRFSLMTGEYAHTRLVPSIAWRMSPAERTLADEFNDAGYHTAYFGKWHLYGGYGQLARDDTVLRTSRKPIPRPYQGRWQHFAGFDVCNDPYDTYYFADDDPTPRKIDGFQTDGLFDLATDYLCRPERHATPFATVISVEPPHPPLTAPVPYMGRWHDRDIQVPPNVALDTNYKPRGPHGGGIVDQMRAYYAMIENLDDNVARLLDTLRSQGLLDSTVVALVADHGDMLGSHGLLDKHQPYEESVGIPFIVAGPIPPHRRGTVVEDPVATEDLFPTLLGVTGLVPRDPKPGLDLAPLIQGEAAKLNRRGVLLEFVIEQRPDMPIYGRAWRGVRTQHGKYTVSGHLNAGRPWQYFDLEADPYEMRNLVDDPDHTDTVREHHQLLRDLLVTTHDHYVLEPAFGWPGLNE